MFFNICSTDVIPEPDLHAFGDWPQWNSFRYQSVCSNWQKIDGLHSLFVLYYWKWDVLIIKKCGIAEMNLFISIFALVKNKTINHKLRKSLHSLPPSFPWSDSVVLVFLIWAESPRRKHNHHRFVSAHSGICLSKESGHSTQGPTVLFSAEKLYFLEYVLNCMNKSLSDTSEQE